MRIEPMSAAAARAAHIESVLGMWPMIDAALSARSELVAALMFARDRAADADAAVRNIMLGNINVETWGTNETLAERRIRADAAIRRAVGTCRRSVDVWKSLCALGVDLGPVVHIVAAGADGEVLAVFPAGSYGDAWFPVAMLLGLARNGHVDLVTPAPVSP
jgi:hypothetical protein